MDRSRRSRQARRTPLALATLLAITLALLVPAAPAAAATFNVNCPGQSLQAKINTAAPGSTIKVSGTCNEGTITIDKNLTITGNPSAVLKGGGTRVMEIGAAGELHLNNLTISGGGASAGAGIDAEDGMLVLNHVKLKNNTATGSDAEGGGILKTSGTLRIEHSTISGNAVVGNSGALAWVQGGAISTGASLRISDSTISNNTADATAPDAQAAGGGIFSNGDVTILNSTISGNAAESSGASAWAAGGGLFQSATGGEGLTIKGSTIHENYVAASSPSGTSTAIGGGLSASMDHGSITNSTISGNEAHPLGTGATAFGSGGGAQIDATNAFTITSGKFIANRVTAGGSEATGLAGGLSAGATTLVIERSRISSNHVFANGGAGDGIAVAGGALTDGPATMISTSTFDANTADASSTGADATAYAGGLTDDGDALLFVRSTVSRNAITSTSTGLHTSTTLGAGMYVIGSPTISNSTIASNTANAISHATQGTSYAFGGGINFTGSNLAIVDSTIPYNTILGSGDSLNLVGGGVYSAGGNATIEQSILSKNVVSGGTGPNCTGTFTSLNWNLLGTDAGCNFIPNPSGDDLVGSNAQLGNLGNYGGPTQTVEIKPSSPAINRIPKGECANDVDQRGVHRPQGKRCDIGAFERVLN